jgi:hypothetical protein
MLSAIKNWMFHEDRVLSILCRSLVERRLLKVKLQVEPIDETWVQQMRNSICRKFELTGDECNYFVFGGTAVNTTYDPSEESINILFKDGSVRDISKVDNALIQHNLSTPVKKNYICYYSL